MLEDTHNTPTILHKRHSSPYRADAKPALISFLSTFYGQSMVAQGHAAILVDSLRQELDMELPHLMSLEEKMEGLYTKSCLLLEAIQNLSEAIGEVESAFQAEMP